MTDDERESKTIADALWIIKNPQFQEKPATILEFLREDYLNIDAGVRPGIKKALVELFGDEVQTNKIAVYEKAMLTGAIGIGKSTFAAIALPYMVHWVLCLRNPQEFFGLLPGSRIAFMMMSTSETQAREVIFGDVFARVKHSKWFKENYPHDPAYKKQIKFDKDINILPGDSRETSFEGYNILGGILDEMDSHTITKEKDYADVGYDCVDEKTTILTKNGWRRYSDLNVGDEVLTLNHKSGQSEWNVVEAVKIFKDGIKDVISIQSDRFSALTTANHRWPVIDNKFNRVWKTTETLSTGNAIVKAAPNSNLPTVSKYDDAFVELVAWAYTEGHFKSDNCLDIYQNFGRVADRITACIQKLGGSGVQHRNAERNCARISINNPNISKSVSEVMQDKSPTNVWISELTASQLELFIQISLVADNCGQDKFAQNNPFAAEAFAFACILAGYPVSIKSHKDRKQGSSTTLVRKLRQWQIKPIDASKYSTGMKITRNKSYDGVVWCPQTKNKSWFARREGSTYFTGNTIENRVTSRFGKRGLIIPIGQMKKATGFASRKYNQFLNDPTALVVRMTIWESRGWDWKGDDEDNLYPFLNADGSHKSFYYDHKRRQFISKEVGDLLPESKTILEIPEFYRKNFENGPEKALKDLAGIPPAVSDPFISLVDKIELCYERWIDDSWPDDAGKARTDLSIYSPVSLSCTNPEFAPWFTNAQIQDNRRRAIHIDLAYSSNGDCLGFAMGHIAGVRDDDEEDAKPVFKFDMLMRIKAPAGNEIILGDVRKIIYYLRDTLKFRITKVTYDGFESTDSIQQLRKKRFNAEKVSMDKSTLPYEDLRDAIYDERLLFPPYITEFTKGSADKIVNIAVKELSELQDTGRKIDHPVDGSKDVTDAMAGVVHELIGDRRYRRGVVSLDAARQRRELQNTGTEGSIFGPNFDPTSSLWKSGGSGLPDIPDTSDLGIIIPAHLRPRQPRR